MMREHAICALKGFLRPAIVRRWYPWTTLQHARSVGDTSALNWTPIIRVTLLAALLSFSLGVILGFTAAISGRWVDGFMSRVNDALMAFPSVMPGEGYFGYFSNFPEDLAQRGAYHSDLTAEERQRSVMFAVPPGHVGSVTGHIVTYLYLQPHTSSFSLPQLFSWQQL